MPGTRIRRYVKQINLKLKPDLYEKVVAAATAAEQPMAEYVRQILEEYHDSE